ncbi:hypothetical protein [Novosphingobium sp. FKTRR1]|uniref:hypothetical protein n=1 Tax=Novosphingobium sp. FKTRR1 TaxID=2879118 RepID=UPI001CEFCEC4|nr:hypothetical protein [Novosphingobium sp. FKTRR1]
MVLSFEFCERRADEAATAAAGSALSNVKDRELRSEAAWRALAYQIIAIRKAREAIEERKALEVAGLIVQADADADDDGDDDEPVID